MKLTVLGSGNAYNMNGRGNAGYLLQFTNRSLLLDFGPTALKNLQCISDFSFLSIDAIALSHFHGDHYAGIPSLLLYFDTILSRKDPLTIYGPPGVEEVVMQAEQMFYNHKYRFPIQFVEVCPGNQIHTDHFDLQAYAITHKVESTGYQIRSNGRTLAYSGDSMYDDKLSLLTNGADLAIVECSLVSKPERMISHITCDDLLLSPHLIKARKVLFTHLCDEVRDRLVTICKLLKDKDWMSAEDGMVLTI